MKSKVYSIYLNCSIIFYCNAPSSLKVSGACWHHFVKYPKFMDSLSCHPLGEAMVAVLLWMERYDRFSYFITSLRAVVCVLVQFDCVHA